MALLLRAGLGLPGESMLLTGDDTGSGSLTGRLHAVARRSAHLTALCALAFAQPLFDILGKNPAFFAVRGTRSAP